MSPNENDLALLVRDLPREVVDAMQGRKARRLAEEQAARDLIAARENLPALRAERDAIETAKAEIDTRHDGAVAAALAEVDQAHVDVRPLQQQIRQRLAGPTKALKAAEAARDEARREMHRAHGQRREELAKAVRDAEGLLRSNPPQMLGEFIRWLNQRRNACNEVVSTPERPWCSPNQCLCRRCGRLEAYSVLTFLTPCEERDAATAYETVRAAEREIEKRELWLFDDADPALVEAIAEIKATVSLWRHAAIGHHWTGEIQHVAGFGKVLLLRNTLSGEIETPQQAIDRTEYAERANRGTGRGAAQQLV